MLFDDMEFLDGATLPTDNLIQPKVEARSPLVIASRSRLATARPRGANSWPRSTCASRDRRSSTSAIENSEHHRSPHGRRQRLGRPLRARRPAGRDRRGSARRGRDGAAPQRRRSSRGARAAPASTIRCARPIGSRAKWRYAARRCAPARSFFRARWADRAGEVGRRRRGRLWRFAVRVSCGFRDALWKPPDTRAEGEPRDRRSTIQDIMGRRDYRARPDGI